MEVEGHGRRGATGLWCTQGPVRTGPEMERPGGLGLRRKERRCAAAVDAVGVAAGGEMGEDLLDEFGRFDARDDAQRAATHAPVIDVDVEDVG